MSAGIGFSLLMSCGGDANEADAQRATSAPVSLVETQDKTIDWIPYILGDSLINAEGKTCSSSVLAGKKLGLYFAAQWSPPCRYFTTRLKNFYKHVKKQGHAFEIVLIPFDHTAEDEVMHMKETGMPWLAVPYVNQPVISKLIKGYEVLQSSIPVLVIIDPDGTLVTSEARSDIMRKGIDAYSAW